MPPHANSGGGVAVTRLQNGAPGEDVGARVKHEVRTHTKSASLDADLAARIAKVSPGSKWTRGPMAKIASLGAASFYERGEGCRLFAADGREYIDMMGGFGCNLLGYDHKGVKAAYEKEMFRGPCLSGPTERTVELAEAVVDLIPHADWAMFAKNGSDAMGVMRLICRACTGKKILLVEGGAYHGSPASWQPNTAGVLPEDYAHQLNYKYNDVASLEAAVKEAGDDLAGIIAGGLSYPLGCPTVEATEEFAKAARRLCDAHKVPLVIDDIRCTLRTDKRGSWAPLGVQPDLSTHCKAIANGHPLSALVGNDFVRDAAARVFSTGTYWVSPAPMGAALEVLKLVKETDCLEHMHAMGRRMVAGFREAASSRGIKMLVSGPVTMPTVTFDQDLVEDGDGPLVRARAMVFGEAAISAGLLIHPIHNWFMSASFSEADVDEALGMFGKGLDAMAAAYPSEISSK